MIKVSQKLLLNQIWPFFISKWIRFANTKSVKHKKTLNCVVLYIIESVRCEASWLAVFIYPLHGTQSHLAYLNELRKSCSSTPYLPNYSSVNISFSPQNFTFSSHYYSIQWIEKTHPIFQKPYNLSFANITTFS